MAEVVHSLSAVVKPSATTSLTLSAVIACGCRSTDLTCCLVSVSSTEPVARASAAAVSPLARSMASLEAASASFLIAL